MTARPSAEATAAVIRGRSSVVPEIGLILGSGLGGLADRVAGAVAVPYADIPGFQLSAVEGHSNELVLGWLAGRPVAVMRGRIHLYEGYSAEEVTFPVRVLRQLGVSCLVVSNAAGGLNHSFSAGELMLIRDHIFLPGMAGQNPLRGPHERRLGPRFPDMTEAYDPGLRRLAQRVAAEHGLLVREGVYVMVAGPSYETPAECEYLRRIGADAVGMSTCPEVIVARHTGMKVLGISLITNALTGEPVSHDEVLATANAAAALFGELVEGIVAAVAVEDADD